MTTYALMFILQYCQDGEGCADSESNNGRRLNTGISLMKIVKELDKGPIFLSKEIPINLKNSSELFDELAILGSNLYK